MLARTLPSLASFDVGQVTADAPRAHLRTQVAVVRTLADQVELLVTCHDVDGLTEQLIEEMARLGRGLFEAAAKLTTSPARKRDH